MDITEMREDKHPPMIPDGPGKGGTTMTRTTTTWCSPIRGQSLLRLRSLTQAAPTGWLTARLSTAVLVVAAVMTAGIAAPSRRYRGETRRRRDGHG
jgi:hypothetical protein